MSLQEPIEVMKGGEMDEFAHVFTGPVVLVMAREYTKEAGSSDTSDEYDEM